MFWHIFFFFGGGGGRGGKYENFSFRSFKWILPMVLPAEITFDLTVYSMVVDSTTI